VIHKKGIENVNADALSRSDHLDEPTKEENEEYQVDDEVGELKITYSTDLEGDPCKGVYRNKFWRGRGKAFGFLEIRHKYKDALQVHSTHSPITLHVLYLSFKQN